MTRAAPFRTVIAPLRALFAFRAGRIEDWILAGGAIGAATATKYTAGAMLLTVVLAAALRVQQDRTELRRALIGVVVAGVACLVVFAVLNPFVVLNPSEARGQITGQSAQADTAKLGQDDTYGWLYYLGTLTWGLGWAPLLAAAAGAVVILRRDWLLGLLLVAFPVLFYLYMGAQGRFFGRWLMPIYPALCVLAAIAAVAAADLLRRHRGWALAALTAVLCVQGLLASVHVLVMGVWLGVWSIVLRRGRRLAQSDWFAKTVNRVGGAILVALGVRTVTS